LDKAWFLKGEWIDFLQHAILHVKGFGAPNEMLIKSNSSLIQMPMSSIPFCPRPNLTYNGPSYMTPLMLQ
jgi:hypothetical protein